MLYGPSCCQFRPPAAAETSAACAWARLNSPALTGCAELSLRSRYSSGSAFPYGLSASGAWASAEDAGTALRAVEWVRPNVATIRASSSAPMTTVALCCFVFMRMDPSAYLSDRGGTLAHAGEMSNWLNVRRRCDGCSGTAG